MTTPADLRDQLWDVITNVRDGSPRLPNDADTDDILDALLPVVEAEIARRETEAAAGALEQAVTEDSVSAHNFTPVEALTLRVVKVYDLWTRAAALRAQGGTR